eukprot:3972728-Pleurochrysis_carterae.AAC.1
MLRTSERSRTHQKNVKIVSDASSYSVLIELCELGRPPPVRVESCALPPRARLTYTVCIRFGSRSAARSAACCQVRRNACTCDGSSSVVPPFSRSVSSPTCADELCSSSMS